MSEDRLPDQPNTKLPDDKKGKDKKEKKKRKNPITRWFREMRSELKKVVWPTRKQVINNTIVVLIIMAISSVALWIVDEAARVYRHHAHQARRALTDVRGSEMVRRRTRIPAMRTPSRRPLSRPPRTGKCRT